MIEHAIHHVIQPISAPVEHDSSPHPLQFRLPVEKLVF
jgi:hypothetical protein